MPARLISVKSLRISATSADTIAAAAAVGFALRADEVGRRRADAVQETAAPQRERLHLLLERRVLARQERFERELGVGKRGPGRALELDADRARTRDVGRVAVGEEAVEPTLGRRRAARAERAAESAMQLRKRDDRPGAAQRLP